MSPDNSVHQWWKPGAAVGQRRVPVVECATQPCSGYRPGTEVPAQQGHLPQRPDLQGDYTHGAHVLLAHITENQHSLNPLAQKVVTHIGV